MSFPLAGNERIAENVNTFINTSHFPHAMLIEGENGTGKRTLAQYISAAAVCTANVSPCGTCRSCHLAKVGSHPDISVLKPEDKKKSISVAQVRQMRQAAYIKPQLSSRRVVIIEQAHTLNEQSQNALLKVLEEPPGDTVFILISQSKAALLPTVLSRCVVLPLTAPEYTISAEYIKQATNADDNAVKEALEVTRGNIGRALALLKKRGVSKAYSAAQEYVRLCTDGGRPFDLLKTVVPLEKERPLADEWVHEIKYVIARVVRNRYENHITAQRLFALEQLIEETAPLLATNINLSLFFSAIVSKTCYIFNL